MKLQDTLFKKLTPSMIRNLVPTSIGVYALFTEANDDSVLVVDVPNERGENLQTALQRRLDAAPKEQTLLFKFDVAQSPADAANRKRALLTQFVADHGRLPEFNERAE